jgi:hypothetical protein
MFDVQGCCYAAVAGDRSLMLCAANSSLHRASNSQSPLHSCSSSQVEGVISSWLQQAIDLIPLLVADDMLSLDLRTRS